MNKLLILCAGLSLCVSACRSDDSGDGGVDVDGGGSGPDAPAGSSTTIYDVQDDNTPVGTSVSLRSVVVTAIDTFGGRTGAVYVQEQDGGAYSGVNLFISGGAPSGIAVGDIVDVDNGVKDEFAYFDVNGGGFDEGYSITQVKAADGAALSITKVSSGTVPEPVVLNAWDLGGDDAEAEKWEGVLIKFEGMRVLSDARSVSSTDDTLKDMRITGPYVASSSMAALDGVGGDCYSSITGVGDYFFNYKITPRSSADIVKDGTGDSCAPEEASAVLCADGEDNDHDGFGDCQDFSCQEGQPVLCTDDTATVVKAQDGSIDENSLIRLTDVIVTAVSEDNLKFWVQDDTAAAAFNGLYVFRAEAQGALDANFVGKKVTLLGNLDEYHGELTELTNVTIEAQSGNSNNTIRTLIVSLADAQSMKDYEGVLVELADATVVTGSDNTCTSDCNFTVGTAGSPLQANDTIFRHDVTAAACYSTFTGIMHYDDYIDFDIANDVAAGIVVLPLEDGLGAACN